MVQYLSVYNIFNQIRFIVLDIVHLSLQSIFIHQIEEWLDFPLHLSKNVAQGRLYG